MSSPSRTAQFAKVHRILKKIYKPAAVDSQRPVLEHMLFACCLENTPYDKAEEAFAALVHTFFDWNEIRVTTVRELSEIMAGLPDPLAAAQRVKKVLQHVFEANYSFDMEEVRKKNLGPAVERLEKIDGMTKFVCNYTVQSALGGHAIPLDSGTMAVLKLLGLATDKDVEEQAVPGLERAIAKNKGIEFGSLLHQLGAEFTANPYLPALHKTLLQINPEIEGQLPKRRKAKPEAEPAAAAPPPKPAAAAPPPKPVEAAAPAAKPAKGKKSEAPAAAPPAEIKPTAPPVAEEEKSKAKKKKTVAAEPPKPAASGEEAPAPKADTAKKKPITLKKVSPDDADDDRAAAKPSAAVVGLSKKKPR